MFAQFCMLSCILVQLFMSCSCHRCWDCSVEMLHSVPVLLLVTIPLCVPLRMVGRQWWTSGFLSNTKYISGLHKFLSTFSIHLFCILALLFTWYLLGPQQRGTFELERWNLLQALPECRVLADAVWAMRDVVSLASKCLVV